MISSFEYILPVIRGIQAGREYYVSMCPVRLLPKLFPIQGEELAPEKRSNRCLNRSRIPEIAKYIINNPENYTLGAIAASIDAKITFEPLGNEAESRKIGRLRVPMDATFTINDGQHRRVAYQMALKENPELGYETVALILYLDLGLAGLKQISSPNKAQTSFVSREYVPIFVQPFDKPKRYRCPKCFKCFCKGV